MLGVHLKNLEFFAYHGVYPEEKILGNTFRVNASVWLNDPGEVVNRLEDCVNYELLFALIKERMDRPEPLLETLVMELAAVMLERFDAIRKVFIQIEKVNPPIEKYKGGIAVSYEKERL
jgi:dihydroneopterin aldolase